MNYSIGEFSKITNLTIDTLRYYEKEGLITPERKENGRRYYCEKDVTWIEFIKRLKETKMPIKEIQKYAKMRAMGECTMIERMEMLIEHRTALKKEISKANENLQKLNDKIDFYKTSIDERNNIYIIGGNNKMKSNNIYVIHGYTSSSQSEWFPWLKEQFKNRQVKIDIPNMPDSENPHLETWLNHLRKNVLDIDENTIFIGHSLGCVTALQYILEKNIKIKGAILVSGFINENPMDEQTEGLQEFVDEPLDIARIKNLIPSRVVITATDDDIVPTEATQKLAEALDANLIILSSGKHFIARDGYTDFPVLLNEIQKLINT